MNDVMSAICRRAVVVVLALLCLGALPVQSSLYAQQPTQQEEFFPADQLPPTEQIPAARLLIAAYAIVLVVLFLYVVTVARRLTAVQDEIQRLESDVKRAGRS
jgi:CcmD family protein